VQQNESGITFRRAEQNRTEQNNGILSLEQSTPIICYTAIHYITMDYY